MDLADEFDFQVQVHADSLNETGYYEDTLAAINGRVMQSTTPKARAAAILRTSCVASWSRTICRARQIRPIHSRSTPTMKKLTFHHLPQPE